MKTNLLLAVLLLLFAIPASAQWSGDAAENVQVTSLEGDQVIPKIKAAPDGGFYIGYFTQDAGSYNVRLQRLDAGGNMLWQENGLLVSAHPSMSWLTDWDMAVDHDNHAILTWQDIRLGGENNTVAYRIDPDGNFVWGNDGIMLSNSTAFDVSPKVCITAANNAVFAWQADNVVIMQKISPEGEKQWGDWGITLTGTHNLSWPQLLPVGDDDVILKYFHDSGMPWAPIRHVYTRRFDAQGQPVWENPTVVYNQGNMQAWYQILPIVNDGQDGFFIAWHEYSMSGMAASTWVQHVNAQGEIQFPANGVLVSDRNHFNQFYPQIASPDGDPHIYVYWNEVNGDQNQWGIYGQKVGPDGDLQWGSQGKAVFEVSSQRVMPLFAQDVDMDVMLVYEHAFNQNHSALRATRLDSQGDFGWWPGVTYLSTVVSAKVHFDAAAFNGDQWAFAWEDDRAGVNSYKIFAQNLNSDGTLGIATQPQQYHLILLAEPEEGGSLQGEGEFYPGEAVSVTATPAEGFIFTRWADHEGETLAEEPVFTFGMPEEDLTLVAHFQSTLSADVPPAGMLRVFPNPAVGQVFIRSGSVLQEVSILDLTGRVVFEARDLHVREYEIATGAFGPGLYLLRLSTPEKVKVVKLQILNR